MKQMNLLNRNRLTDLENELELTFTGRERAGKDSCGVWDGHVHTDIIKMDNQQGPTV